MNAHMVFSQSLISNFNRMKRRIFACFAAPFWVTAIWISVASCGNGNESADAYGNFEADEVIVSAQMQGTLIDFDVSEGLNLEKGSQIGLIDTTLTFIRLTQLNAQKGVARARQLNLNTQLAVQEEQRLNLERELRRLENLFRDKAATEQQLDDMKGKMQVHIRQTEAIESQRDIISGEILVISRQQAEILNQLEKCRIEAPISGIVLEKYGSEGELVNPGKSLFKMADMDELELRVYISGAQLPRVSAGDTVQVRIDAPGGGLQILTGQISWISDETEFTPKIIQTREERVNMVYAVKVRVKNDGRLKIGMPGEVVFTKVEKQ